MISLAFDENFNNDVVGLIAQFEKGCDKVVTKSSVRRAFGAGFTYEPKV
jgi:hypothetical protein